MNQNKKNNTERILILDLDGAANYEYPHLILDKAQDLVKADPYGDQIWNLFKSSAEDVNVKPQALLYINFKKIRETFDVIYVLTARLESWRVPTEKWLAKWNIKIDHMLMRPDSLSKLTGAEIKEQILKDQILNRHKIEDCVACDDDDKICDMYKRVGVKHYKTPHGWVEFLKDLD